MILIISFISIITILFILTGILALKYTYSKERIDKIKIGDTIILDNKEFIIKKIEDDMFVIEGRIYKHLAFKKNN